MCRTLFNVFLRPQPGVSRANLLSLFKDRSGGRRVDQDPSVETGEVEQINGCLNKKKFSTALLFKTCLYKTVTACAFRFTFGKTELLL